MYQGNKEFKNRIWLLITAWGIVGLAYTICGQINVTANILPEIFIDKWLGFNTYAIWPYLSFLIFVPLTFFIASFNRLYTLRYSIWIVSFISTCVFIFYPSTMIYPEIEHNLTTLSDQLWVFTNQTDNAISKNNNCLPSLHASLTVMCLWAMWDKNKKLQTTAFLIWGSMIIISIVQAKRHVSIDVLCGVALGLVSICFIKKIVNAP